MPGKHRIRMAILLVGFDSAWTAKNYGALVGATFENNGALRSLGLPQIVRYGEAERQVLSWQKEEQVSSTIVMLDQPTIVPNNKGQRPVEHIVGSIVGLRRGGMQPANTSKLGMFDTAAPIWQFLSTFGGPVNPYTPSGITHVYETYPVLTMIALGWTLEDTRASGRLPKYNPARRKTFRIEDWRHVCKQVSALMNMYRLLNLADWLQQMALRDRPTKSDQDGLDACICLLVAIQLARNENCLVIGNYETGYIVVPDSQAIRDELKFRCDLTAKNHLEWIRTVGRMQEPS